MKLTFENNKGDKIVVIYDKNCITDTELELNPSIALDPLFETLKNKIVEEDEKKNA